MIKLYKIVTNLIFILLIVVLGIYVFLRFTNKVEIYCVQTGSMEDNIHVGDYVLIYKKDDYNIGDVITYQKNDYFITHRIIRKENNEFITKGDANNTEDEKINSNSIVGKVIISGGILNIIVNYKYALAAIFVAMYLVSCYFGEDKEKIIDNGNSKVKDDELNLSEDNNISNSDSLNIGVNLKENELINTEVQDDSQQIEENEQLDENKIANNNEEINDNDITNESVKDNNESKDEQEIENSNVSQENIEEQSMNLQNDLQQKIISKKKKNTRSKK